MAETALTVDNVLRIGTASLREDTARLEGSAASFTMKLVVEVSLRDGYQALAAQTSAALSTSTVQAVEVGPASIRPAPLVLTGSSGSLEFCVSIDQRDLHQFEITRIASGEEAMLTVTIGLLVREGSGSFKRATGILTCRFAQSRWADLLQKANYSLVLLHKFPPVGFGGKEGERYRAVVESFQRSERHLMSGDAAAAVSECRNTLNILARIACGGAEFTEQQMKELLATVQDGDVRERILSLWKGLRAVTNEPHHPRVDSNTGERIAMDPDEARYVLSVVAATLEFTSTLLTRSRR